ncbi:MAG TPA: SAM-dependent methyltransferase [Actinomycetota bacterium]|nr:SAM-dependent methyltransferase [Actinomycetota bacterium]
MSDVAERIRSLVRRDGPITFARFMHEALYAPGGFYERPPVGPEGHFVTSPHVHPVFSRLVGAALEALSDELGRPRPLRVVELGAGDGTMAREILDGFTRGGIELDYAAVEVSPGARAALTERGIRAVERMDAIERLEPGLVVANELLDNLPFRRVRRRAGELVEVAVGVDDERLVEVEVPWPGDPPGRVPAEGKEILVPTGAFECLDGLSRLVGFGYVLLIDYGNAVADPDVRGYRAHRLVTDLLADPGAADVTAGVDFRAVATHAERLGWRAFEPVTQRAVLRALGLDQWMSQGRLHQTELLESGRGADAVRIWEGRNRARLLVDPAGLGGLRWLLLATPELDEPTWLRRAREIGGASVDRRRSER